MRLSRLLCFVAAILFFGCSTDPNSTSITHLFPLAFGNYWTYDAQAFNDSGKMTNEFVLTTEIFDTVKFGKSYQYRVAFGDGHDGSLFEDNTDLFIISDTNENAIPIIRYPMDAGQTLPLTVGTIPDVGHFQKNLTFHGENESVTVPAGSFSCYHYEVVTSIDSSSGYFTARTQDSYYAAGIGLVEEIDYSVVSGIKKKFLMKQLSTYKVN